MLAQFACTGCDAPVFIVMPHTRAVYNRKTTSLKSMTDEELAREAKRQPEGFIEFAVNLVRPVKKGLRGGLFYGIFGSALVFDTLRNA